MRESELCEDLPGGAHHQDRLGHDVCDSLSKPAQQRKLSVAPVSFPDERSSVLSDIFVHCVKNITVA